MSYLIKQEDMLDLKMEDNSDNYLFNSLLDMGQLDPHSYDDDDNEHFAFISKNKEQQANPAQAVDQMTIINELAGLYNLRTAHMTQLINYTETVYDLTETAKIDLIRTLRRYKFNLKRVNAKNRVPSYPKIEESIPEVKIEYNAASELVYDDESQETKKKKRNRMSAQKSRDRRKQYIKEIEKMNRDMKRKLEQSREKNLQRVKPDSRALLKVLLCLGITCFVNTSQSPNVTSNTMVQQDRLSTETIQGEVLPLIPKLDLDSHMKMLPLSQQIMLQEALSSLGENNTIDLEQPSVLQPIKPGPQKKHQLGKRVAASLKQP